MIFYLLVDVNVLINRYSAHGFNDIADHESEQIVNLSKIDGEFIKVLLGKVSA